MVRRVGQSSRQPQAKSGCAAWIGMGISSAQRYTEDTSARAPPGKSVVGEKSRKKGRRGRRPQQKQRVVGGRRFRTTADPSEKPGVANIALRSLARKSAGT